MGSGENYWKKKEGKFQKKKNRKEWNDPRSKKKKVYKKDTNEEMREKMLIKWEMKKKTGKIKKKRLRLLVHFCLFLMRGRKVKEKESCGEMTKSAEKLWKEIKRGKVNRKESTRGKEKKRKTKHRGN